MNVCCRNKAPSLCEHLILAPSHFKQVERKVPTLPKVGMRFPLLPRDRSRNKTQDQQDSEMKTYHLCRSWMCNARLIMVRLEAWMIYTSIPTLLDLFMEFCRECLGYCVVGLENRTEFVFRNHERVAFAIMGNQWMCYPAQHRNPHVVYLLISYC